MAATNLKGAVWKFNTLGATKPYKRKILFGAGASQAVKRGEILDYATGTAVPLASDKSMSGIIAIADCEIKSGDLAGYHMAIIPQPGDIFEFKIATAAAPTPGSALYWSDSQTLATSGSNILGYVNDDSMVPEQGFQSVDPSPDATTTLATRGKVLCSIKASVSQYVTFHP